MKQEIIWLVHINRLKNILYIIIFMIAQNQAAILYFPFPNQTQNLKELLVKTFSSSLKAEDIILQKGFDITFVFLPIPLDTLKDLEEMKVIIKSLRGCSIGQAYCDHHFMVKIDHFSKQEKVEEYFAQFGEIASWQEKNIFQKNIKICYLKYSDQSLVEKVLNSHKRHTVGDRELEIRRNFNGREKQLSDQQFYLKIFPRLKNPLFDKSVLIKFMNKFGSLRQNIRIYDCYGNTSRVKIAFASKQKELRPQDWQELENRLNKSVTICKKSFGIVLYATHLRSTLQEDEARKVFEEYGQIKEMKMYIHLGRKKMLINYQDNEVAQNAITQCSRNSRICDLFLDRCPKVMEFLSTEERNRKYRKKEKQKKKRKLEQFSPPRLFHNFLVLRSLYNKTPKISYPMMGMGSFHLASLNEYDIQRWRNFIENEYL